MSTSVYTTLSPPSSKTIQAWAKEVNLRNSFGEPATLAKACQFILEDFADVLRLSEEEIAQQEQEGKRLKELIL